MLDQEARVEIRLTHGSRGDSELRVPIEPSKISAVAPKMVRSGIWLWTVIVHVYLPG